MMEETGNDPGASDGIMISIMIDYQGGGGRTRASALTEIGLDRDVTELSGGQRTKVLLGKASS